jgi:1,4-alpha-glucan branching enzyme
VKLDPWLSPFKESLRHRYKKAQDWIQKIEDTEGGLDQFSKGTEKFGFNVDKQNNITYREWAPNATQAFLIGEFSISPPPSRTLLLSPN